jgi:hypothetical protein
VERKWGLRLDREAMWLSEEEGWVDWRREGPREPRPFFLPKKEYGPTLHGNTCIARARHEGLLRQLGQ